MGIRRTFTGWLNTYYLDSQLEMPPSPPWKEFSLSSTTFNRFVSNFWFVSGLSKHSTSDYSLAHMLLSGQ
ncbi:hypothetical protein Y032_0059g2958 [Ancylostoma ceylanicum]|uniref:Uncharacterized protein n=1 Tax=Ancylostoma ceylanicum TaxID=53326 RepID=A0A016U4S9_9BILA|nr:hypothetical protein Y032_0059g2958 [Ancylostoma ceylanicum]